jgi:germination protein M
LADQSGRPIVVMRAEDFVQNTGSSIDAYQTTDLILYFADKDGLYLKERKVTDVHYNVNTTIERVVVERLMKGTSASGYQSTIPKTTMLLGVSVKEDICYVNLDSKFVSDSYDINPELAIYSIVNSVIANSNVTKVQILIDGVSDVVYKSSVDLARPLKQNVQLIQEGK